MLVCQVVGHLKNYLKNLQNKNQTFRAIQKNFKTELEFDMYPVFWTPTFELNN